MKLNLIFLSVVLVMQYEWLGVNCGCENIDTLESFEAKTQGGKAAVLMLKCGTDAPTVEMARDTQKEMENDFGDEKVPDTFRPLKFPICPAFFLFKDGKEIKRVSERLEKNTYGKIDALCDTKV